MPVQVILAIVFSCFLAFADLRRNAEPAHARRRLHKTARSIPQAGMRVPAKTFTLQAPLEPPYVYIKVDDAVYPLRID